MFNNLCKIISAPDLDRNRGCSGRKAENKFVMFKSFAGKQFPGLYSNTIRHVKSGPGQIVIFSPEPGKKFFIFIRFMAALFYWYK